jgi:hypothetical protein
MNDEEEAADKTKTKAGIIFVGPKNNKGLVLGKYIESLTDKARKSSLLYLNRNFAEIESDLKT